jgi:hypothetical protein
MPMFMPSSSSNWSLFQLKIKGYQDREAEILSLLESARARYDQVQILLLREELEIIFGIKAALRNALH